MISVIVPIYNIEKFLPQCLDSLIAQSEKALEFILVDDGSTDRCPQICDAYAKKDARIKVIHKQNEGLISARKSGLQAAAGEYIGFVDGDDWIEPDMYAQFAQTIEQFQPDLAICEFYYAYPQKEEKSCQKLTKRCYSKAEFEQQLYPVMLFTERFYCYGINPCCWSKVFKKELLEKRLYPVNPAIKIGEDAAFTYPCLLDAQRVAYVDRALYHYRINEASMTKAYDPELENTILLAYEILQQAFESAAFDFSEQLQYYLLSLVNGVIRNEANASNQKTDAQIMRTLRRFTDRADVRRAAKQADGALLPFHTKLVVHFLSTGNVFMLYLYSKVLRRFL